MMPEIKLFIFPVRNTALPISQHIRMNQGVGRHYEIPVPGFLLTHPDGFTLIDGGLAVEGLKSQRLWGSAVEQFKPVMSEERVAWNNFRGLALLLEDILVVLSHLHSDHAEQLVASPMLRMLSRGKSIEYAFCP